MRNQKTMKSWKRGERGRQRRASYGNSSCNRKRCSWCGTALQGASRSIPIYKNGKVCFAKRIYTFNFQCNMHGDILSKICRSVLCSGTFTCVRTTLRFEVAVLEWDKGTTISAFLADASSKHKSTRRIASRSWLRLFEIKTMCWYCRTKRGRHHWFVSHVLRQQMTSYGRESRK